VNREYRDAHKAWVLHLVAQRGLGQVHRDTGIPRSTLHGWVQQAERDARLAAEREARFRRRRAEALCIAARVIERHESRPLVLLP
jgi:transposase-like protein